MSHMHLFYLVVYFRNVEAIRICVSNYILAACFIELQTTWEGGRFFVNENETFRKFSLKWIHLKTVFLLKCDVGKLMHL